MPLYWPVSSGRPLYRRLFALSKENGADIYPRIAADAVRNVAYAGADPTAENANRQTEQLPYRGADGKNGYTGGFSPVYPFLCLICIGLSANSRYSAVNVQLAFVLVRVPAFMRVGSPLLNLEK